jgi:hypothetical protein
MSIFGKLVSAIFGSSEPAPTSWSPSATLRESTRRTFPDSFRRCCSSGGRRISQRQGVKPLGIGQEIEVGLGTWQPRSIRRRSLRAPRHRRLDLRPAFTPVRAVS